MTSAKPSPLAAATTSALGLDSSSLGARKAPTSADHRNKLKQIIDLLYKTRKPMNSKDIFAATQTFILGNKVRTRTFKRL